MFDQLKGRLFFPLVVLTLLGWGLFVWQQSQTEKQPTERLVTKTEFKDRVVTKLLTQIVTKPDGTKIETRETSTSQTRASTTASEKTISQPQLPKNSFGAEVKIPNFDSFRPKLYDLQYGRRLGQTNLWTTTSLTVNDRLQFQAVYVGLRYDF